MSYQNYGAQSGQQGAYGGQQGGYGGQQGGYGGQQGGYGGQQGGYGQYNPYEQQQDNRQQDSRHQGYGNQGGYGGNTQQFGSRPEPQQTNSSHYPDPEEGAAGSHEMTTMNGGRAPGGRGPDHILNECRAVDRAIDDIEQELQRLEGVQQRYLADTNTSRESPLGREVDRLSQNVMTEYRGLVDRVRNIKSDRESGNPRNAPQVGKVDRRLKTTINRSQQLERDFRRRAQDQIARQYRIVRPEASDAEVQEAVEDTSNQQVFSQALIQSDRRGDAQRVAQNVRGRHQDIQKIEQQMMELAQLFQDLETLVVQQEPAVTQIEQKGEEVTENVGKGNTELDGAITKARSARRKKWICLGICVAIVIVIIIIVLVVLGVNGKL